MADYLFTDIASNNGDLATNVQGDLDTASGIDNLTAALQRRFETPIGALFYDRTYGNSLFNRLSQPMGQNFEKDAIADVTSCMLADSRVQSATVQITVNREQRTAVLYVQFIAKDGSAGSFQQGVSLRV